MPQSTTPPAALWTVQRTAEHYGVSAETVRRWAKEGRIRHQVLPSGRLRFDPLDLQAATA